MINIEITSKLSSYQIQIENNLLNHLEDFLDANRYYVIISDNQIPREYIEYVLAACPTHLFITFPAGEQSKSFEQYKRIISIMQEHHVKRDACIIALGGGVTGDLAGFVASTYNRGIDYIQIPTTLLAQIDSSVGGKVAINTENAKNSVGQFYPPIKVLIDPKTLDTLSERQFNNGMAEMIKYGMIYSYRLFQQILEEDIRMKMKQYIYESLLIKKHFVENDETDCSIRQILNFGHTYGHAYEAYYGFNKYLHGEAISLGMVKVCEGKSLQSDLIKVLQKYHLPIYDDAPYDKLLEYVKNDKKNTSEHLNLILVDEIGKAYIKETEL